MLNINPLAALSFTFGRRKSKASRHYHIKSGALADARENVKRVHRQVANFEQSCVWHNVDDTDETRRCVDGFFAAMHHHENALTEYSEENVEAMDLLERASGNLVAAASTLYAIDPALFRAQMGVELMSAVRGLDSKEAFERYLADLKMIAEGRRERAAFFKQRREEGYVDANGKDYSPADLAEKAKRDAARRTDPTGRDVALESRLSEAGRGRQDTASNEASMRSRQDMDIKSARRLRNAIAAAHAERNALPPPSGAKRVMDGYVVRHYLVPQGELNPATWDRNEIARRVAEYRERSGVSERDRTEYGKYVHEDTRNRGWCVEPPVAELRKLGLKERAVYNDETRSCVFPEKAVADVVIEKFLAPSTSDSERKAIMGRPREAFICAHCGRGWLDRRQSTGVRLAARQRHEQFCTEEPSSSEDEDSDEDESEVDEPEEVVAPPPKRARFFSWPWRSSE